ncbi:MAG: urease accessory protein UreD [Hyphomicrobiaceae bacterium]|nr:urease accessory protein UreD [Hyphomicrobiaceae bacterium]
MQPVRAVGGAHVRLGAASGRTVVRELKQSGGYRLAMPSTFADHIEVSQINTGGGVAGGDRVETSVAIEQGADAVFSTQGAERIYRSSSAASEIGVRLTLAAGGRLDWLPQQTILYAGARLRRRIEVDAAADSRLLMVEMLTFGRPASEECGEPARVDDQWRIRRGGRLVLTEALRLTGEMKSVLARPAVGGAARASAIVVHLAPDAPDRIDEARSALENVPCEAGVSAWNGLMVGRFLAQRPADVIVGVSQLARALGRRDMPRVWSI